jgi:rRNA-processing protein FCF1
MADDALTLILCDANVLIDYFLAGKWIFKLVARHVGPVHVLSPILDEVDQIDIKEADRIELTVIEPDDSHIIRSGQQGGPLSRVDKLLITVAKEKGYICWTSDSRLMRHCKDNGIKACWGLEMMLLLCRKGCLSRSVAVRTAGKLQRKNSRFITQDIINQFEREVKKIFE